jgi:DNA-binding LacI/PurR family transcriptional regulator
MTRALKTLVQEGTLSARPRQGIKLCSKVEPLESVTLARSKVETVASDLVRNILAGSYGTGDELPSLKELQAYFGVCFRTMKRVVDSLVSEGVLSERRRGYRLRNPAPRSPFKTLVLIVGREYYEHLPKYSYARSFFYPLLYALERECGRRNIRLELQRFPSGVRALTRRKDAIAYLVALDAAPAKETIELLARLLSFDVPVLVAREGENPAFSALPVTHRLVFLETNNELAGFQIGQYLLARGYQRITYFTHFAQATWSIQRCRGIERALHLAGIPRGVKLINLEVGGLEAELESLLRSSDRPAWVACDDALATDTLMPHLRERGLVPGADVSVIAFNDQLEAFESRLSSYNFNTDGLAAAALFHAQFPERRRRRAPSRRHEPVLLGGYIIDRGSVRASSGVRRSLVKER